MSLFCMQSVPISEPMTLQSFVSYSERTWMNLLNATQRLCRLTPPKQLTATSSGLLSKKIHLSASPQCCLCYLLLVQKKTPLCEGILHELLTCSNWPIIFSLFRADLAPAFLCADPPTTSAIDLRGLLSLLVRDNSVSLVCLLGTVKIMCGDSAVWAPVC